MPAWQRVYLTTCGFVIGYALTYVGVDYGKIPRLVYRPYERAWSFGGMHAPLPMGYVGLWSWALLVGLIIAALVFVAAGLRSRPLSDRALRLGAAWTFTAVGIAGGYFTWHNWP